MNTIRRYQPPSSAQLLRHVLERPELVAAVRELPGEVLGGLLDRIGLEDAGEIVALAKARPERRARGTRRGPTEERLFLAPDAPALELPRHSAVRALLERVRNEAHRFAIAYHRKERGKIRSRLDSIDGVGAVRRKALLRRFGSVQGIEKASVEELASVPGIGPDLAAKIKAQLAARER